MIFYIAFVIVIAWITKMLIQVNKDYAILAFCKRIKTVNGKPLEDAVAIAYNRSIFYNTFDLMSTDPEYIFYRTRQHAADYKRSYVEYILGAPIYDIIDPADAELVLNDSRLITKGLMYKFLYPFIKTGLLTSSDQKWHDRRKMLTPAFHFNILGQFLEIFKNESNKFVNNMHEICKGETATEVILDDVIPRFTLNTICETAMGVSLDDCIEGDRYRENIQKVEESFVKRVTNPLLFDDFMYKIFGDGAKDKKYLDVLHAFTSGIIKKRRDLLADVLNELDDKQNMAEEEKFYRKERYAMLDTLLRAEKANLIDHAGICEEVDTFVFEGFDTTSMNLIFALMNLALYPEKQKRCYDEICKLINDDLSMLDITNLNKLKYLECCVKETQRLYPSVPGILRECVKDTALANNLLLPKGTQVAIHIFDIQRNEKYFDKPNEFIPERFLTNEQRHPFAFIPFSAGQRNCIGQKFAVLEVKTLLVYILRNFELQPITDVEEFKFYAGILIRSKTAIKVKFCKRKTT